MLWHWSQLVPNKVICQLTSEDIKHHFISGTEYSVKQIGMLTGGGPVNRPSVHRGFGSSSLRFEHLCIVVKSCLTFELEQAV